MAVNEIPVKSYLNLERDPVSTNHAVTKGYVDSAVQDLVESKAAAEHTHVTASITDLGAAAKKGVTTSVISGSANLVTSGGVFSYIFGLNLSTTYAAKSHTHTLANIIYTGSTGYAAGTTISGDSTDGQLATAKAVYTYVSGGFSPTGHKHAAGDIDSGTLAAARLPNATASAKGGVIVGAGLSVSSGTVSVDYATCKTGLGLGSAAYKSTGTSSGNIPVLDSNGKLADSVIPSLAITDTFEASSQSAMLGLSSAKKGDVCIRTDLNKCYILSADGYSTLANWKELKTPTDSVQSVNAKTGAVSLTLNDLYATSSSTLSKLTLVSLSYDTYKIWTQDKLIDHLDGLFDALTIESEKIGDLLQDANAVTIGSDSVPFGEIGYAVSDVAVAEYVAGAITNLNLANTYAAKSHDHAASNINSGTLAAARLPDATDSAKGAVTLAKAAASGTTDTTNDTKAVTPKAAKQIADAAAASATAAAAKGKIYTFTGNGSTTDFTCTHGLGISNVLVQVFNSSGQQVWVAVTKTSTAVTIKFAAAPAAADGQYTAVILGVAEAS